MKEFGAFITKFNSVDGVSLLPVSILVSQELLHVFFDNGT
jgi:hypothetical protein